MVGRHHIFNYSKRDSTWQLVKVEESELETSQPNKSNTSIYIPPEALLAKLILLIFDPEDFQGVGRSEKSLRLKDKLAFLGFIADDSETMRALLIILNPANPAILRSIQFHAASYSPTHRPFDSFMAYANSRPSRNWIIQFVAESGIVTAQNQNRSSMLCALLYARAVPHFDLHFTLQRITPAFSDIGDRFYCLYSHPDYEVRWRVGYVLCYMKNRCDAMRKDYRNF